MVNWLDVALAEGSGLSPAVPALLLALGSAVLATGEDKGVCRRFIPGEGFGESAEVLSLVAGRLALKPLTPISPVWLVAEAW